MSVYDERNESVVAAADPFSEDRLCPKCQWGALQQKYHFKGTIGFSDQCSRYLNAMQPAPEHIDRNCPRCGFYWIEGLALPLIDATQAPTP